MTRTLLAAALLLAGASARAADPTAEAAQAYTLDGSAVPATVPVGGTGTIAVVITPRTPAWHVHPQAPLKIKLEAPAGIALARTELGRKDVADPKAEAHRFEVPFTASAAGRHDVKANVDFFICSDTACVKQVRTVAVPVTVK